MKKISKILFLVFLSFLFLFYSNAKSFSKNGYNIKSLIKTENINLKSAYNISSSKIPIYFIQNNGQFNKKALFYARTSKYFIWITKKGLIFDSVRKNKIKNQKKYQYKRDVSRLLFKGANKSPQIVPIDKTKYRVNYFTGKDKSKWKTGISTSKAVVYKNIYPYIDLKIYGKEKQIEYDWIIKPGGNPTNIRFEFKDVKCTELDNKGNIIIRTEFGKIIHKRASAYQSKNNKIDVRFKKLSKNSYTFNIGKYNKAEKLIIDPLILLYSTYLGGSSDDWCRGIAVDSNGCAYITGSTDSTDFPLKNPIMNYKGDYDVFVTKLSTDGQSLIYSTYLGGNSSEGGRSIAVDTNECAYVTGWTSSEDFPLKNPIMNYKGDYDAFVTKLSTDGQSLVFSTYLGGSSRDCGYAIAVDANECAYITGETSSSDFPLQDPYMTDPGDYHYDAFVTKLSADGQSLIYSTYLGGNFWDLGNSIAVDSNECVYVTGRTCSTNFPLQNPYMNYQGDYDTFVVVFKPIIIISGARKTERAWIINRDYGELNLLVIDPQSLVNVSKYVIYRKVNNGTYEALLEISGSSFIEGSYTYIDKFLDKDKTYTYKFIAYDFSNNIIAISNAISI